MEEFLLNSSGLSFVLFNQQGKYMGFINSINRNHSKNLLIIWIRQISRIQDMVCNVKENIEGSMGRWQEGSELNRYVLSKIPLSLPL